MEREAIDALWQRYLAGEQLTPGEEAALADALRADPQLRAEFLRDEQTDGALNALGRSAADGERFAQRALDCLAAESDSVQFAARVQEKVEAEQREQAGKPAVVEGAASGTSKSIRPASSRRHRRVHRRREGGGYWGVLSLAACLAIAVVGYLLFTRPTAPDTTIPTPTPVVATNEEPARPVSSVPTAIAILEFAERSTSQDALPVIVRGGKVETAAKQELLAGDRLETRGGTIRLKYFDEATTLELKAGAVVRLEMVLGAKLVRVEQGVVAASVAKQPEGKPMRFVSALAEATVLGTELSFQAAPDATWLEVQHGNVQLTRLTDQQSVQVASEQFAVAGKDIEMAVRTVSKGPANLALKQSTKASSVFEVPANSPIQHTPDQANDGEISTNWGSFDGHIKPDFNAWWQVDLGLPSLISRIEIVARQDDYNQYQARANFEVRASNRADGSNYIVLARHQGEPFAQRGTWSATVSVERPFRFIRVVQTKANYSGFSEVRIIGRPWSGLGERP
jgi:hypothetical protein